MMSDDEAVAFYVGLPPHLRDYAHRVEAVVLFAERLSVTVSKN